MLLKKVEIYGFKTFADRTVFEIGPGITCIVGPNGCGKSNLVDALRWVLGEQAYKALRCQLMTDVIFNGTPTRKPLGYAEASLYFDNTGRHFPVDCDELCVTRRVYRTGESDYLVNREPCRMRDIRELFANTGLGKSAYSIIGQNQIDAILQSSPKERRVLFEQAAGVAKYKQKRIEAARKLDRVANDLDKVQTLATEVEKRLKKATTQAAKARRHKQLSEEFQRLRMERALIHLAGLRADLDQVSADREAAQKLFDAAESLAGQAQAAIDQAEAAETGIERKLGEHESRAHELELKSGMLRSSIASARKDAADARARAEKARAQADELAERTGELEKARTRAAEGLEAKERALASLEDELARAQEKRASLEKEFDSLKALREEKDRQAFAAASSHSRAENEVSRLEKEIRSLSARREKLERGIAALAEELEAARGSASRSRLAFEETLASSAEKQRKASVIQGELVSVREELARLDEKGRKLRSEEAKLHSRLDFLRELDRKGEGIPEAARELARAPGAVGILADLVSVSLGYEKAAEAALGELVTAVVAEEEEDELLRRASASGATILRARPLGKAPKSPPRVLEHEGVVARAIDLFWCDPRVSGLFERLFGGVYIAEGLHRAWRASKSEPDAVIVTTDGGIVVGWGKVRTRSEHKGGVISRRNEIASREGELARLRETIRAFEEDRKRRADDAARLAARLEALNSSISEMKEKGAHAKAQLAAVQKEEERLAEEKGAQEVAFEQADIDEAETRTMLQDSRREAEETALVEEEAKTASKALREDTEQIAEELARTSEGVQEMRVHEAGLASELKAARNELSSIAQDIEEKETMRRSFASDGERESERVRDAESTSAEAEMEFSGLRAELEQASSVTEDLRREKGVARSRIEEMRGQSKAERENSDRARGKLGELQIKETQFSTKVGDLLESGERELGCRLDEELSARGAVEPRDSLEEDIASIERRLRVLGTVNHEALAEQEELSKKIEFLQTQLDDLRQARNRLKELISQLNRKSRALFRETFERVKQEYEVMFRKLFQGGMGELKLEDGEDVLEAGVEMIAKPPGKNPKTLLALSGGERGLTAIALLFAIFKTRPSPFCVLDEADAPLDDENNRRFIRGIADFSKETQFVIVTHKKVTMAHANAWHGVTMQEAGVTKKISVSLEQVDKALSAA